MPVKPSEITATSLTETSFTLSWASLASARQPVERFNIVVRSETSEDLRQFVHELGSVHFDRVSTSFEVGDLVPGMRYLVEISAVNEAGAGVSSEQRSFWTHAAREWLSWTYMCIQVTPMWCYQCVCHSHVVLSVCVSQSCGVISVCVTVMWCYQCVCHSHVVLSVCVSQSCGVISVCVTVMWCYQCVCHSHVVLSVCVCHPHVVSQSCGVISVCVSPPCGVTVMWCYQCDCFSHAHQCFLSYLHTAITHVRKALELRGLT